MISRLYRDFRRRRWERSYLKWLTFADNHCLWFNLTQEHIAAYLPHSKSAALVAIKKAKEGRPIWAVAERKVLDNQVRPAREDAVP